MQSARDLDYGYCSVAKQYILDIVRSA